MTALLALFKLPIAWLALAAFALWGVYQHQDSKLVKLRADLDKAQHELSAEQIAHKQLKQANQATETQAKGTANNEKTTNTQLAGVARAVALEPAGRLFNSKELADFIERHRAVAQGATDAKQRAAAADQALSVCTDVLGRADETAGELAGFAGELGARLEGAERWGDLTADTINAGPEGQVTP